MSSFKNRYSDEIRKADLRRDVERAFAKVATTLTATKTAAYVAVAGDFIPTDASGGAFPITLPTAVGLTVDQGIIVQEDVGSTNAVTVGCTGGETIDGAATKVLTTAYGRVAFVPVDGRWRAGGA